MNRDLLKNTIVLYVEDEKQLRQEVSFHLKKYIKNFYTANNGEEGIKLFYEIKPDIIITDIQMPKLNGLEMIRRLNTNIPVIITTAYSDVEYLLEAIKLNVNKFVMKPINLIELVKAIQESIIRDNLQEKIFEKENLLKIINENVLISITDVNGIYIDVSNAFCKFTGYSKEELLGKSHMILRHKDTPDELYSLLWKTIKSGKTFKEEEVKYMKKNGEEFICNLSITPAFKDEKIVNYTTIRQDITSKKKLEQLTIEDDLTKLYNRRYFNKIISSELQRLKRAKSYLSLLTLDIDYFKKYNDMYGHIKGDKALTDVAKILKESSLRASDFVFRLGGEEFGIIFSDLNIEESLEYSNNIVKKVFDRNIEHLGNENTKRVTVSAGLITLNYINFEEEEKIYKYSDDALYEAKHSGKNRVVLSKKSK
ncbi:diguanylate cyclase [Malaciobacter marinus]|uniref:GGDEF domain-containing response regulator n=1 Tax=Malaciobacter marinus TaxID=505249 RepID=UPI0009C77E9B|nr:diguanylate cyclase [Malaciobacter marinus]SKB29398.1 PAS domain S-box-containing protein/diguanylate cyclase (GGDEF) domain-containing protein [Malaciobacter marinus]